MMDREHRRRFANRPAVQWGLFVLGVLLMIVSPIAGVLPGPGGILLFAAGLSLVLRTSLWAKRHYVRFKRWQPRAGKMTDWGLRRQSHRRREALRKDRERADTQPPHCGERTDDPLPQAGFQASPLDPTPAEIRPAAPAGSTTGR